MEKRKYDKCVRCKRTIDVTNKDVDLCKLCDIKLKVAKLEAKVEVDKNTSLTLEILGDRKEILKILLTADLMDLFLKKSLSRKDYKEVNSTRKYCLMNVKILVDGGIKDGIIDADTELGKLNDSVKLI